jgi:chromosomal replication initiation ATPase DnaA
MNQYLSRIEQLEIENKALRKKVVTLSRFKKLSKHNGNVNMIFEIIYEITGYDKKDFVGYKKTTEISIARQLAIYMVHKYGGIIQYEISKVFCRHHSSIIYTLDRVNNWQTYPFSYLNEIKLFYVIDECIKKQIELRNDEL